MFKKYDWNRCLATDDQRCFIVFPLYFWYSSKNMREVSIAAGHLFTKARQQHCEAPKYASFHTFQVVPESRAAPHMQIEQLCLVLPGWSLKKGQLPHRDHFHW